MSTCGNHCDVDGRPVKPYAYALGRRVTLLCDCCYDSLIALGMALTPVERRVAALPVVTERRHGRPAWLERLTARDESGRLVA